MLLVAVSHQLGALTPCSRTAWLDADLLGSLGTPGKATVSGIQAGDLQGHPGGWQERVGFCFVLGLRVGRQKGSLCLGGELSLGGGYLSFGSLWEGCLQPTQQAWVRGSL